MLQYLGHPYFARRDRTREVEALQATNIMIGMAIFLVDTSSPVLEGLK